jgi:hypothetical protein
MASFKLRPNFASGGGALFGWGGEAKFVSGGSVVVRGGIRCAEFPPANLAQLINLSHWRIRAQRDRAPADLRSAMVSVVRIAKEQGWSKVAGRELRAGHGSLAQRGDDFSNDYWPGAECPQMAQMMALDLAARDEHDGKRRRTWVVAKKSD